MTRCDIIDSKHGSSIASGRLRLKEYDIWRRDRSSRNGMIVAALTRNKWKMKVNGNYKGAFVSLMEVKKNIITSTALRSLHSSR